MVGGREGGRDEAKQSKRRKKKATFVVTVKAGIRSAGDGAGRRGKE